MIEKKIGLIKSLMTKLKDSGLDAVLTEFITTIKDELIDFQTSDLDMVLIELICKIADEVSDFQDRVMDEAYLSTASKRLSLKKNKKNKKSPYNFGENKMKSNAKSEIIMVFTLGILFAISPITSAIFNFITGNSVNSIIALIIFLSIATVVIVITSLRVELITKRSYPREDEKYQLPIYGISAVVVESAGALLFILSAIFLNPYFLLHSLFWRFILLPFTVGGIIISRVGLKKDIKKNLAGLGIRFGILLLILYAQLTILTKLFVVPVIMAIAAVVIGIFLVGAFLNQKKKNKRIPR